MYASHEDLIKKLNGLSFSLAINFKFSTFFSFSVKISEMLQLHKKNLAIVMDMYYCVTNGIV